MGSRALIWDRFCAGRKRAVRILRPMLPGLHYSEPALVVWRANFDFLQGQAPSHVLTLFGG